MCGRTKWCFAWYSDPELAELQHPSQRFYSNNYAIWFVLFRALFFSCYTFKVPGSTCREKSSFIVILYLPNTAASCCATVSEVTWQALCQRPQGRIWCNVHSGLPLRLLAMPAILFLVIAYVQGHCFWCVGYLPVSGHGGLPCSLQLHNPYSHSWVSRWHCLQEGGPLINIRKNTRINTEVSRSSILLLTISCTKFALIAYSKTSEF